MSKIHLPAELLLIGSLSVTSPFCCKKSRAEVSFFPPWLRPRPRWEEQAAIFSNASIRILPAIRGLMLTLPIFRAQSGYSAETKRGGKLHTRLPALLQAPVRGPKRVAVKSYRTGKAFFFEDQATLDCSMPCDTSNWITHSNTRMPPTRRKAGRSSWTRWQPSSVPIPREP